jgi:hypothetical protein
MTLPEPRCDVVIGTVVSGMAAITPEEEEIFLPDVYGPVPFTKSPGEPPNSGGASYRRRQRPRESNAAG